MRLISFIKGLVGLDEDFYANESITPQPVKNINNQVDLGAEITDDIDKSATEEVHEVTEGKKDVMKEDEMKDDNSESTTHLSDNYNLIILDESGSMSMVRDATISGCNETLISIRNLQKEQSDIRQFVSIFCFDSSHSRYIFHDTPVDEVRDMTREDYSPSACTPLYDAIGYTVLQLFRKINRQEGKGNVTIITDGYENASRKWTLPLVQELIATLKKKGWVFSFIGANIDVKSTANSLGIDSFMQFEQTQTGMEDMFKCERRSRRAYNEKRRYMQMSRSFFNMSEEAQNEATGAMNEGYFIEDQRIAPDNIVSLQENQIFVFGSNIDGAHNGGAAYYALQHFGAKFGQAEGIQGQSYAIPTDGNSFEELKKAVERFTEYAVFHPQYKFMLTAVGTGNAGYEVKEIAPLFRQAYTFGNVYVPRSFMPYVDNTNVPY
ncbi:MAG: hypothetical protein SO442_06535 [Prevotella sp.]|nr:hypothetical protein [Prevotella sp.]